MLSEYSVDDGDCFWCEEKPCVLVKYDREIQLTIEMVRERSGLSEKSKIKVCTMALVKVVHQAINPEEGICVLPPCLINHLIENFPSSD